ncbi:DUF6188 family protein [Modestobacter lacusdianchii]
MPTDDAAHATALAQELLGQSLDQLCVGAADAQLRFTHSTVSLWSTIGVSTGDDALVRPYTPDGVALLLPLLGGEVSAVDIDSRGRLSFTLGGATVSCGRDPDYEAWSYDGRQGEKVVCTPGGDLAIWNADR